MDNRKVINEINNFMDKVKKSDIKSPRLAILSPESAIPITYIDLVESGDENDSNSNEIDRSNATQTKNDFEPTPVIEIDSAVSPKKTATPPKLTTLTVYKCNECSKVFKSQFWLKSHTKIHSANVHKCEICGRIFQERFILKNHSRVHRTVDERNVSASISASVHNSPDERSRSLHLCVKCGKSCATHEQLSAHVKLHQMGKSPYECHICGKGYEIYNSLVKHVQQH